MVPDRYVCGRDRNLRTKEEIQMSVRKTWDLARECAERIFNPGCEYPQTVTGDAYKKTLDAFQPMVERIAYLEASFEAVLIDAESVTPNVTAEEVLKKIRERARSVLGKDNKPK